MMRQEKLLQSLSQHPVTDFYTKLSERSDLLKYAQQNEIPISVNKKNIKANIKES